MCRFSTKLLILFFTAVVADQQSSNGSCLIQKFNRATTITTKTTLNQYHEWRVRQMSLMGVVNQSKSLLDQFIDAQTASKASCSSRLLESKRVLDGLLKDVSTLNSQVMSREEIMETETQNLAISKMSIEAVKTEYMEAIKQCRKEFKEAVADYKKYRAELIELNQIAMPNTRYDHAVSAKFTNTSTTIRQGERLQKTVPGASLLQVDFDKQKCLAFVDFVKKHDNMLNGTLSAKGCDEQREELKKAFKEAYVDVSKLKEAAKARALDKSCYQSARVKMSAELVPLISQRDATVEKIIVASEAIVALIPVMNLVKDKAEKLKKHISETLTPECKEADQASKLLVEVRKLIVSLEECPGRNDFKLEIPSKEEITSAIKAMEEEAQKEADKLKAEDLEDETPAASDVVGDQEKAAGELKEAKKEIAAQEANDTAKAAETSASLASTTVEPGEEETTTSPAAALL